MGHDFRPDYLRIGELRRKLNVPLAAFTATADAETRREIIERLFDGVLPKLFYDDLIVPTFIYLFSLKTALGNKFSTLQRREKDSLESYIVAQAAKRKACPERFVKLVTALLTIMEECEQTCAVRLRRDLL